MIIFLDYYLGTFSDLYTIQLWFVYPDYTYVKSSVTVITYSTKHLILGPRSMCGFCFDQISITGTKLLLATLQAS